jgi:rare lipoprotein A
MPTRRMERLGLLAVALRMGCVAFDRRMMSCAVRAAPPQAAALLLLGAAFGAFAEPAKSSGKAAAKPQVGVASYYGSEFAGQKTASGTRFDPKKMTAASPTLPLGTKAKVTNKETGRTVHVTVTDRGPGVRGRILDLSAKAARLLGFKHDGVAKVKVAPTKVPAHPK